MTGACAAECDAGIADCLRSGLNVCLSILAGPGLAPARESRGMVREMGLVVPCCPENAVEVESR